MLKKRDEKITAAVQSVIDATAKMPCGAFISWEFIRDASGGFHRDTHPQWGAFRRRLMNEFPKQRNGTVLFHLKNGGWTILTAAQQITLLPAKRAKRAGRQLQMTKKAVSNLDDTGLPVHMKAQQARVIERTKQAASAVRRARKDFLEAYKHTTRNPLRPKPNK